MVVMEVNCGIVFGVLVPLTDCAPALDTTQMTRSKIKIPKRRFNPTGFSHLSASVIVSLIRFIFIESPLEMFDQTFAKCSRLPNLCKRQNTTIEGL